MGKRKKEDAEAEEEKALDVPGDLLPEILSQVPYRSLCRLKCVSTAWLALCSDPAVRKRSPQTLSGFFCHSPESTCFFNLSGRGRPMVDPSLRFLRGYQDVKLLDCCAGILLCSGWNQTLHRDEYIVCNPATEEVWAAVPMPEYLRESDNCTILCFDPAVPGRFTVFVVVNGLDGLIDAIEIYSSNTGEWTSMECGLVSKFVLIHGEPEYGESGHVFLNGTLHLTVCYPGEAFDSEEFLIVTVDMDGSNWSTVRLPRHECSVIGQSQGRLYAIRVDGDGDDRRISVWALEDYANREQWTLKHTASLLELLGRPCDGDYKFVTMHPESNLVFFSAGAKSDKTLMSYDMDNQKLHVICTLEEYSELTLLPYIPCFMEWPSVNSGAAS